MRKLFIIAALLFTTSCTVRKSSEDNVNTVKPHLIVCFSRANTNSFPRIENSYGDVTVVHGNDIEYIEDIAKLFNISFVVFDFISISTFILNKLIEEKNTILRYFSLFLIIYVVIVRL